MASFHIPQPQSLDPPQTSGLYVYSRGLGSPKHLEIPWFLGQGRKHYQPWLFQSAGRLLQSFWFISLISTHCQWVGTLPIIFDVFEVLKVSGPFENMSSSKWVSLSSQNKIRLTLKQWSHTTQSSLPVVCLFLHHFQSMWASKKPSYFPLYWLVCDGILIIFIVA